jgi:oligopeptide transport system substrate-binding protein
VNRSYAIAAVVLAACGRPDRGPRFRPAGSTTPRTGGTLRFAVSDQVRTLDPTIGYDEVGTFMLHSLFDTLVDFAPAGGQASFQIVSRLARSFVISPDGRGYTFELRPGITYSDGTPITAAHFKYSLERTLGAPDSPFTQYLGDIEGAQEVIDGKASTCAGIVAVDDRRLEIRLVRSNPALLEILAMPFATPQRRDHVIAAGDQLRRQPDATGPFELARWSEGERIELRRNPHYYDPTRAHLDAIVMLENIPNDTQFQMFETAELDTAEKLTAPDYLFVMNEPAWQPFVHLSAPMNAYGSRMNVRVKPFDDRRVRQALNYALDKQHTARLLRGTTVAAHGILPPGMPGFDPELPPYPHDVARARALLREAGYPDGIDVDYMTIDDEETETVAASLQSDLAEAGVRVHLDVTSWAVWLASYSRPDGAAFSFTSWTPDFPDTLAFFEPRFHSRYIKDSASTNDSFYRNPELDGMLDAAREERDPDKRAAMYRRAERILYDDAPWIWDYHRRWTEVTQPYVRGYEPHPIWRRDYTSAWLDLGPDGAPVSVP